MRRITMLVAVGVTLVAMLGLYSPRAVLMGFTGSLETTHEKISSVSL
jgi:hypothetical protein